MLKRIINTEEQKEKYDNEDEDELHELGLVELRAAQEVGEDEEDRDEDSVAA